MNKAFYFSLICLATFLSVQSYGQENNEGTMIEFEIKRTLSGIPYSALDVLREAELALQEKTKELCGTDQAQSLTMQITISGNDLCSRINPRGSLSGDFQNHRTPAVMIGRCYPNFSIKGKINCKK